MTKPRCPTTRWGVVGMAYEEVGGLDQVLVILPNRKRGWLYAATDPDLEDHQQARLNHDELRALTKMGAVCIASDFARLAGMQLVALETGGPADANTIMLRFAELMRETAEAVRAGAEAVADNRLTRREVINMRKQLLEVVGVANGLLADLPHIGEGGAE